MPTIKVTTLATQMDKIFVVDNKGNLWVKPRGDDWQQVELPEEPGTTA